MHQHADYYIYKFLSGNEINDKILENYCYLNHIYANILSKHTVSYILLFHI